MRPAIAFIAVDGRNRAVDFEREVQAERVATFIEEFAQDRCRHVILAEDFNAGPDASSMLFWRGRRSLGGTSVSYLDAWESVRGGEPGATSTPRNPLVPRDVPDALGRRIDYVLVRCNDNGPTLRVVDCRLAFAEPAAAGWASDHFAVVTDFSVFTDN